MKQLQFSDADLDTGAAPKIVVDFIVAPEPGPIRFAMICQKRFDIGSDQLEDLKERLGGF